MTRALTTATRSCAVGVGVDPVVDGACLLADEQGGDDLGVRAAHGLADGRGPAASGCRGLALDQGRDQRLLQQAGAAPGLEADLGDCCGVEGVVGEAPGGGVEELLGSRRQGHGARSSALNERPFTLTPPTSVDKVRPDATPVGDHARYGGP
jgi:hypothetical protein